MKIFPPSPQPKIACIPNTSAATPDTNFLVTNRDGFAVTADATIHTLGAYVELIASTAVTSYGLYVFICETAINNANTSMLVNIAVGAAGAESVIVPNINAGESTTNAQGGPGRWFYFPGLKINSGSRIAANCQALISGDACQVGVILDTIQYNFEETTVVTYGADTANSRGTSVTPATGFAAGDQFLSPWTEIGTTSRDHHAFVVGPDLLADTIQSALTNFYVEVGIGSSTSGVTTIGSVRCGHGAVEDFEGCHPPVIFRHTTSGDKLYARLGNSESAARGLVIHGI